MRRNIRAIVSNADESYASILRALLLGCEGVHIVAEVDDLAMLGPAVAQFPCDLLVVHLDPSPEASIAFVGQVLAGRPDLPAFAISQCSDGKVILTAMRAGMREYLTKPVEKEQVRAAIDRVCQQVASRSEPGCLISVMSSVGGAGATTIAANLAVELAGFSGTEGPSVALVDLDYRFGQIATLLDVQPQYSMADLCDTPEHLDPQLLARVMVRHSSGVDVLARPPHFKQAEMITAAHCAAVLSGLQDLYKYVVVDGPTRFDVGAKSVLDLAAMQFIVIQLLVPSVRNVHRILEELGNNGYNLDRVKLICNRLGRESGYLEREHVETTLDRPIFFAFPDDWKAVSDSVNIGVPLAQSAAKSRIRQAFAELAELIHKASSEAVEDAAARPESERAAAAGKKGGGLLSKIFSTT
jgi:pilus assembly protein CpaE